jgi:hypothetical protein
MKYLRRFNENISMYDPEWKESLPETFSILKGEDDGVHKHVYKKGNIMLNSDMVQITYYNEDWGIPDTLEFDIHTVRDTQTGDLRLDIDITYGNEVACEFSIDKTNGVRVIQDTTFHSKFDPSNTVFAFTDDSLKQFVEFLNRFNTGIKVTTHDLRFLDGYDNYQH